MTPRLQWGQLPRPREVVMIPKILLFLIMYTVVAIVQ